MTAPPPTNKPRVLPLVVTTRDLVRWSGIHRNRLARWMDEKAVPYTHGGGAGGRSYNLEDLQRLWPELVTAIRRRMESEIPNYDFFAAPK